MTLNCIIIDSEAQAVERLKGFFPKVNFLNLVGAYSGAIEAMKHIRQSNIDLIFMDVKMPELSGIEFARILPANIKVVFTTQHEQYAVQSYRVNALDYILKPISFEDFFAAASKALNWFIHHAQEKCVHEIDRLLFVKSDYKTLRIKYDDILYIEGVKDYVKIYTDKGEKPIMSLLNMKKLDEHLPSPEFLRTHRSFIVNMSKVTLIDRFRIVFGDVFIPVTDSYKPAIMRFLEERSV